MRKPAIPYDEIAAADGDLVAHNISPRSQLLLFSQSGILHWDAHWYHQDGSEITAEEKKQIEDWASKAEDELLLEAGGSNEIDTPFWDTGSDADDQASPEDQTWYGVVDNYSDPPADMDFVENAAIWALTGFIAYSGDIGAAIFFHSIAPRFVLAWKRGDVGEIWRIVVNSVDQGTVNTSSAAENDVVTRAVQPAYNAGGYDILVTLVG